MESNILNQSCILPRWTLIYNFADAYLSFCLNCKNKVRQNSALVCEITMVQGLRVLRPYLWILMLSLFSGERPYQCPYCDKAFSKNDFCGMEGAGLDAYSHPHKGKCSLLALVVI